MPLLVSARGSRPVVRVALLLAGILVTLLLTTTRAAAHAELVGSDPPDGAEVLAVPSKVSLNFSEAGTGSAYVAVTGPDGTRAEVGEAIQMGTTVTQRLDARDVAEPAGRWTIAYRVVSDDGHPIVGELTFTVATPGAKEEPAPSAGQRTTPSSGSVTSPEQSTTPPTESAPSRGSSATWFAVAVGGSGLLYALLTWFSRRRRHA